MTKLVKGSEKTKRYRFIPSEDQGVPGLFGPLSGGNSKAAQRRVQVLNSVFHENITDLLSSTEIDPVLQDHNFLVTKVKYATDGSALHVYWTGDSAGADLVDKLPQVAGKLRHTLTQLQIVGRVPHINFIQEKNLHQAVDVEELLARADYGPDYEPMASKKLPTSLEPLQPVDEDVYTSTNVLGLDRDAIINQVLRSMNRAAKEAAPVGDAESSSSVSSVAAADKERRVDFRKYLQRRRIERAKQERMADRTWQRRVNETNRLALAGDDRQSDDWSDNTLDDYLDEEPLR